MNRKRIALLALFFMVCGFLVYGQTAPRVYISGSCLDGVTVKACYWVDGERVVLEERVDLPDGASVAIGIAVENGNVYVAGKYDVVYISNSRYVRVPCYWVNGVKSVPRLEGVSYREEYWYYATGIAVTDGKVYVTGYYENRGSSSVTYDSYVWIDGVRTGLGGDSRQYVRGITIIDGTACFLYPSSYTFYGQSQSLVGNTTGITVAGGRIYVSGYNNYYDRSSNATLYTAHYWVDGTRVDITQPSRNVLGTTGIAVANDTVYVSGWYRQGENSNDPTIACYWANGTRIDLANGVSTSGIAVANGNVYVIGYFRQGSVSIPCYWVNGERRALPGGRSVTGIVVK